MTRLMRAGAALLAGLLSAACAPSDEQTGSTSDRGSGFDFYVLALSWSPSYCREDGADPAQCSAGSGHQFIVHGLWPQFEDGYPEFCEVERKNWSLEVAAEIRDLLPTDRLVRHQWRKHGSCSGLDQHAYFETVREARNRIKIPDLRPGRQTSPREVEAALITANPGLTGDAIAVTCSRAMLREIRICLSRSLEFRPCPEIGNRDCRRRMIDVPAPR